MLPSSSTAVMVTLKDVAIVGVEVAGTTEKEPAPAPSAGVLVEVTVVVVVPDGTVPGPDVVMVDGTEAVVASGVVVVDPVVWSSLPPRAHRPRAGRKHRTCLTNRR